MLNRRCLLLSLAAVSAFPATAAPVRAETTTLALPRGRVLLEVAGAIAARNADASARFDQAMLEGLPRATQRTATPWTSGPQVFEGVLLRSLLAAVGATGTTLTLRAINDYEVEIPVADVHRFPVLLAYAQNGRPMPVRERGPLWVIYPLDSYGELQTPVIHARMIWQLKRIVVA